MDPRVSRFREHLRRLAATARPSYAECVDLRQRRRAETARAAARWLPAVKQAA